MRFTYRFLLTVGILGITACTATTDDTHFVKAVKIGELTSNLSDAKTRYMFVAKRKNPDADTKFGSIICAEPSPDALSQLASAVAVQAQLKVNTGETDVSASGKFEKSFTEAVQNIGKRTAAIQLLRDGLYRACEAYANDGIDDFGYALVLASIDNVMLKLVALETLAENAAPTTESGKALVAAADSAKLKLSQAVRDLAAADKNSRDANRRARSTKDDEDTATANVAGLAKRRLGVETALNKDKTDLQTEQDRDLSAADTATKDASAKKVASLTRKIQIQEREIIDLDAEIAVANSVKAAATAKLNVANADNTERTAQLTAALGKRDLARSDSATADAAAEGVDRELSVGGAAAIVKIATGKSDPGNIVAACLAWTAKHGNETNPKMHDYCNRIFIKVGFAPVLPAK